MAVFPFLSQFIHNDMGETGKICFSEDKWLGNRSLYSLYSRLYHFSSLKNHSIALILVQLNLLLSPSLDFSMFVDQ